MTFIHALVLMVGGVVLGLLPGWLAYSGKWRDWRSFSYTLYAPLACLWLGIGLEAAGIGFLLAMVEVLPFLAVAFGYGGLAFILLGVFCLFWTPPPLQPRWLREERQREKEERRREKEERRRRREELRRERGAR